MRYFIDTEFIESGPARPIELISIGIVSGDGREFYAVSCEYDASHASDWVKDNVLANLEAPGGKVSIGRIAKDIKEFINPYSSVNPNDLSPSQREEYLLKKPEFWGYYAAYDWVVFCQIFGTMMDLPKGFPMYCRDIKQLCDDKGNPKLPEQGKGEHNALADARWNKIAWEFLQS